MVEASWILFTVASLVLIVTPGQDMVLVMSRSIAQGAGCHYFFDREWLEKADGHEYPFQ